VTKTREISAKKMTNKGVCVQAKQAIHSVPRKTPTLIYLPVKRGICNDEAARKQRLTRKPPTAHITIRRPPVRLYKQATARRPDITCFVTVNRVVQSCALDLLPFKAVKKRMLSLKVFVALMLIVAVATAARRNKIVLDVLDKSVAAANQTNGDATVLGIRCGTCLVPYFHEFS
jgi:hypothetical protein